MIIESVMPSPLMCPTIPETTAAIIKTIIIKSLNCSKNFTNKLFFFCAFNSLYPYFSRAFVTCSVVRPSSRFVSNFVSVSLTDKLYQFFSILSMGFPPVLPVDFCIITKNSPVGRPHGRVFFCYTQRSSRATVSTFAVPGNISTAAARTAQYPSCANSFTSRARVAGSQET